MKKMIVEPKPIYFINGLPISSCTLNHIVEHVINSREYKQIVRTICKHSLWEELLQELSFHFLTSDKLKLYQNLLIKGEFPFYFTKAVKLQWHSTHSSFYQNYKKHLQNIEYNSDLHDKQDDYDEMIQRINSERKEERILKQIPKEIKKLNWYQQKIWNLYVNQKLTLKQITELTGINGSSAHATIQEIRKILKRKIKN